MDVFEVSSKPVDKVVDNLGKIKHPVSKETGCFDLIKSN